MLVATVPLLVWAFAQDGLTTDGATMALRIDAGQGLGALILLLAVTLTAAGLAVGFMSDVHTPSSHTRARAGRVLIGAIAVVPAVAILLLANAPGGIDGQVSKAWKQATDPATSGPSNSPERLTSASSNRARYWREAMKVHGEAPVLGSGAGAYGTLRLRYREDYRTARHAHGYVVQTLADLGWVGLGLSLLAAIAWLVAMVRVLGIRRRDRGLPWDAERVGLATLAAVALLFGIHSTIDWTWFVPANVVPALICAGFVASRSTLRERLGAPATVPASVSAPAPSAPTPVTPPPSAPARGVSRVGLATAALVVVIALAGAWSALQPVRSANAMDEAAEGHRRGRAPARGLDRPDRPRPQPARGRPLLPARVDRACPEPPAGGQPVAAGGDRARARQPRGLAAARGLPGERPERPPGRAARLPGRLLPRSEVADEPVRRGHHVAPDRYGRVASATSISPARLTRTGAKPVASSV